MEFDPESQTLKCPSCGASQEIENIEENIREHSVTQEARQTIRAQEKTSHTMVCQGCGAKVEVDALSTAVECPYCGSKYVLADKQEDALVPDGVIPFQFDKEMAGQKFTSWVRGRFWAPGELKHLYQRDRLQGIYLPYWTFDAQAEADYQARGGQVHHESYQDSNGKTRTRTYVTWHPVSGHISYRFDDLLVPASNRLDTELLEGMDSFNTEELASYAPEYLSGYGAECFSVSLDSAYHQAIQEMRDRLTAMAESEVLSYYDRVEGTRIYPVFSGSTYKHVLVPVYATAYQYRDELYHVLINGQTGMIKGEYPKSVFKIALCVLLIILLLALFFYFF